MDILKRFGLGLCIHKSGKPRYVVILTCVLVFYISLSFYQGQRIIDHFEKHWKELKRLHSHSIKVPIKESHSLPCSSTTKNVPKPKTIKKQKLVKPAATLKSRILLLGIFTTASNRPRRDIIRQSYFKLKSSDMDVYFVIDEPQDPQELEILQQEHSLYQDIFLLKNQVYPYSDSNGNTTLVPCIKTYKFYHQVYLKYADEKTRLMDFPFKYIMKVDDDVWVHLSNLEKRLSRHRADKWVYFGRQIPKRGYMAGMGYVLSRDWVKYIGTTPVSSLDPLPFGPAAYKYSKIGQEDAIIGAWLLSSKKKIKWVSEENEFYDYPDYNKGWAHPFTPGSILIHQVNDEASFKKTTNHFLVENRKKSRV